MKRPDEYQKLIYAAFLHDIGKFSLRAGHRLNPKNERDRSALETYTRITGSDLHPRFSYYHAAMTDKFFREFLSPELDEAGHLAALHHMPKQAANERHKLLARIITLADWLSSGERVKLDEEEDPQSPGQEPLISIFSQLSGDFAENCSENKKVKETKGEQNYYIPLSPLDVDMNYLFPLPDKQAAFRYRDYPGLWDDFIKDLKKLREDDNYFSQLYYLLNRYLITMPSAAFKEKADISLFHHLKSTTAIACCFYQLVQNGQLQEQEILSLLQTIADFCRIRQENKNKSIPVAEPLKKADIILVGGDISGIQSFIYEVTSEKALKGLRARSFYVQLISEAMAKSIIKEFNLPETNILYCGGGNFYLLIPALKNFDLKLKDIQKKFDSILVRAHKGKMSAVLSWAEVSYFNFLGGFDECWNKVGTNLARDKKRKFSSLLTGNSGLTEYEMIFGPLDLGGERRGCRVCSEELTDGEVEICPFCTSLIDLASRIKDARAIVIRPAKNSPPDDSLVTWFSVIQNLGYEVIIKSGTRTPEDQDWTGNYQPGALLLNTTDFAGKGTGFYFLPNKTYSADGEILTLEKMAEKARGIEKWGVLRADVDNLGTLFKEGLGDNKTISRVAMLSFMISSYFSGRISQIENWVNAKTERNGINTSDIYIAYSGGDDLFIIGPWSELLDLAFAIYNDFREFTCNRLTLSAGIYYAPSKKFPIYQAAHEAGDAVETSKTNGKNRLTLFETPILWSDYPKIKEIIQLTVDLLEGTEEKKAPRSLLNILYSIHKEKELKNKEKDKIHIERIWRLYYAIKKIFPHSRPDDEFPRGINKLIKIVITDYEVYPYLNIATRVADYLMRKK